MTHAHKALIKRDFTLKRAALLAVLIAGVGLVHAITPHNDTAAPDAQVQKALFNAPVICDEDCDQTDV
ncbi:MAG: hypothetical protein KDK26_01835 [Roseivivax sp.]|nr:hypothetical protein [Roseivivax sp.]